MSTETVLIEVADERAEQDAKWGEQDHPDGTGPGHLWPGLFRHPMALSASIAKEQVDFDARSGRLNFAGILLEEVFEAISEDDVEALRGELIQVAAVAVAWVEAINRRSAKVRAR